MRSPTASSGWSIALPADAPTYPDLAPFFPCAGRMQRAAADLLGIVAAGARDTRPWLDHGAWPPDQFPLHEQTLAGAGLPGREVVDYPFVRVGGDGVHEIPVGPVHAGIIEPGHFRFSVVGEKVLRLEERLGYTHKGIEKRFTELAPLEAHRLAGRVCGDSTVAYAWAYCMALESAAGCAVPRARPGCARSCWSASASPTTSATSARSATMPPWRSACPSSPGCAKSGCACRRQSSATGC